MCDPLFVCLTQSQISFLNVLQHIRMSPKGLAATPGGGGFLTEDISTCDRQLDAGLFHCSSFGFKVTGSVLAAYMKSLIGNT